MLPFLAVICNFVPATLTVCAVPPLSALLPIVIDLLIVTTEVVKPTLVTAAPTKFM